jgi:glycosyltransferase involved in cell wall biosynthesis
MSERMRICIVGLKCFDHIARNPIPRYLGGIETQLAVLARALVTDECAVSIITYDHGQDEETWFDGVRVLKSFAPDAGLPFLRSIHPRTTQLWRAMRRADAQIYLQMGAGLETAQVAWGSRWRCTPSRRFVFCLASDANCDEHLKAGFGACERMAYRQSLHRADRIVAQTDAQRIALRKNTGLDSCIVPMAVECPRKEARATSSGKDGGILWVGRITPGKRLEWLVELAERCSDLTFDVVGSPNRNSCYATRLLRRAAELPNLRLHGRISQGALVEKYQSARLLCCTSMIEGFPTTFLEAWSYGLPILTTFDPDRIVRQNNLGIVADNQEQLILGLRRLLNDASLYISMSQDAQRYYARNHAPSNVAVRFRMVFSDLLTLDSRLASFDVHVGHKRGRDPSNALFSAPSSIPSYSARSGRRSS